MSQTVELAQASYKLHFLVVGGGIAGLSCAIALRRAGHEVSVYEQSDGTYRSPMVMRCPPHATRILNRLGVDPAVLEKATAPLVSTCWLDGATLEAQNLVNFHGGLLRELGAGYHLCQHGQLYGWLLDLAQSAGANIRFNARVAEVEADGPAVLLESGEIIQGDIVIGADGWNSRVREVVTGGRPPPVKMQSRVAYSMLIPEERIWADPEISQMAKTAHIQVWMGDGCSVTGMHYPPAKQYFVVFMCSPSTPMPFNKERRWNATYPIDELNLDLTSFAPCIKRLVHMAERATPLYYVSHVPLDSWINEGSQILVVGDAGEPSPQHTFHGADAPMGDGLVLGTLFSHISSPDQIPVLLGAFDEMRRPRAQDLAQDEEQMMTYFALPAGPAVDIRTAAFRTAAAVAAGEWAKMDDEEGMRGLYDNFIRIAGYDAYEVACDWWTKWGASFRRSMDEERCAIAIPVAQVEVEVV